MKEVVEMIPPEKLVVLNLDGDKSDSESDDAADRLLGFLDDDFTDTSADADGAAGED